MELIPIIYTVLEIVAGLAVITLVISYIAFKAKQKNQTNISTSIVKPHKLNIEPKHVQIQHNNFEKKIIKKEKPAQTDNKIREEKKSTGKESHGSRIKHNEQKPEFRNDRISVLENLESPKPAAIPESSGKKNKAVNTTGQSLGDNILDKYVEENGKDMFTLSVKEKKEKPE
jgi:hypothetical protein